MKTKILFLPILIICILCTNSMAQGSISLDARFGINNSDLSTGLDAIESVLPREDYPIFLSGNSDEIGFFIGATINYPLSEQLFVSGALVFTRLNSSASIGVFDELQGPLVIRPIREEVPTFISGTLKHDYLDLGVGIQHFLMRKNKLGLYVGGSIHYLFHVNTTWDLEVKYEDLRIEENKEIADLSKGQNYQNLLLLGLEIGYAIDLAGKVMISPFAGYNYGFNTVVKNEEVPNPTALNLGLQIRIK